MCTTTKCIHITAWLLYAGMADLVPDVETFSRSLYQIQELPLYYLNCALNENCLSSSAYGKPYHHRRCSRLCRMLCVKYKLYDLAEQLEWCKLLVLT